MLVLGHATSQTTPRTHLLIHLRYRHRGEASGDMRQETDPAIGIEPLCGIIQRGSAALARHIAKPYGAQPAALAGRVRGEEGWDLRVAGCVIGCPWIGLTWRPVHCSPSPFRAQNGPLSRLFHGGCKASL